MALFMMSMSPCRLSVIVAYCCAASPDDAARASAHSFCLPVDVTTILLYASKPWMPKMVSAYAVRSASLNPASA